MTLEYQKRPQRKRFKQTLNTEAQKAIKSLIITLSLMIVALAIAFIALTNQSAQKGYTLQQTKIKNEQLKNINSILTTKITQATAFQRLSQEELLGEMNEPEEKKYVTNEDNSVY